jgi:dipeptide/tripeptide permease
MDGKDGEEGKPGDARLETAVAGTPARLPWHVWLVFAACIGVGYWRIPLPWSHAATGLIALLAVLVLAVPKVRAFVSRHPLADLKFFFFIFCLIPVQTLFTYNWLVLPQYIERSFEGWIGDKFEVASNLNPILIFIAVPIIAALTRRAKVYDMMILGTAVMAAPAFLMVLGPSPWTLFGYIGLMTIGEAMWQPRFLQYAAEIAPEGRTGEYMGVAQLPWFLTKMLAPVLLTGWMMDRYCPAEGPRDTRTMWLVFACVAMASPVLLVLAKGWLGKDFKSKS